MLHRFLQRALAHAHEIASVLIVEGSKGNVVLLLIVVIVICAVLLAQVILVSE